MSHRLYGQFTVRKFCIATMAATVCLALSLPSVADGQNGKPTVSGPLTY